METDSQHRRDRGFALAVALGVVVVLLAMRFGIGADVGLGARDAIGDSQVATGIVEYPEDNFAYVSYIEQTRNGAITFVNSFAAVDQAPIYCNPMFLVLGWIAALTGAAAAGVLVVAGLLAAAFTVYAAHGIARDAGLGIGTARWTAVLVGFGSGLSAVSAVFLGGNEWMGVDRTHQDAVSSSVFAVYPFQAVTLAVLTAMVWAMVRQRTVAMAVLTVTSALLRPYECVMFVGSYGLFALLSPTIERGPRFRRAVVAGLCAGPVIGYALWVGSQPAWKEYSEITIGTIAISRVGWIIGYGMFLPAAAIGILARVRPGEGEARRWFAIWVVTLLVLLVVVHVAQVKISSGGQIPLAILAAHGCTTIARWIRALPATGPRRAAGTLAVLAALGFFPTTVHLMVNVYEPHHVDAELVRRAEEIRTASPDEPPRVLCDAGTGIVLPGLNGARVWSGHWSMTPDRGRREDELVTAGVNRGTSGYVPADVSQKTFDDLVSAFDPDFLLLRDGAPAVEFARAANMRAFGAPPSGWHLFRVD